VPVVTSTRPPGTLCRSVVDQVGHHPFSQEGVAFDERRPCVGLDVHAQAVELEAPGVKHPFGERRKIDPLPMVEAALAAGQGEQGFEEPCLFLAGGEHLLACCTPTFDRGGRVGQRNLQQGPLRGERAAQFVGRVGHKVVLGFEGRFEPGEEVIEGVGQLLELLVGTVKAKTLVQVGGRDPLGGSSDLPQRAQHPAGDDPAEEDGQCGDDSEGDRGADQELVTF
jgi:hypothetical protein